MPRGVHPASLANLKRGYTPTKKPRVPRWNNNAAFAARMTARRLELKAERERLAAQAAAQAAPRDIAVVKGAAGEPAPEMKTRVQIAPPVAPPEVWIEMPVERRTVSVFDEWTIVQHGSARRRVVGRAQVASAFVKRHAVGRYPVIRAWVGRGIGWEPVYWQPDLDVLVDEDQLDRIVTPPDTSDADRRADLSVRDLNLVKAGKALPADPPSTFARVRSHSRLGWSALEAL